VTFCIQDMQKEEFYSTLLEDRFISFLIKQIKINAKEEKIEEILKLIDNLEQDSFPISSNKILIENNPNKEMTRFSSFLDLQLKEIIERQNALEKQIQSIKANNNINNLNNLNKLLEKNGDDFYIKEAQNDYINSSDEISTRINDNSISNSIIKECNHQIHSHANTINNPNPINICNDQNHGNGNVIGNHSKINHYYVNPNIKNNKNEKENFPNNNGYLNIKYKNSANQKNNTQNLINNYNGKNENFTTIDELVDYIENNEENKTKKNKKRIKNSKKKNSGQNQNQNQGIKSPSQNKNQRIIEESVVDNFKKKIQTESCYAENVRKIKPALSIKWIKSINNKIE
jgi:hypothetical protein